MESKFVPRRAGKMPAGQLRTERVMAERSFGSRANRFGDGPIPLRA
jgi:hypothetical protein